MKKAKYVLMALLLSASIMRVSASNWSFTGSFLNIKYTDTPSTRKVESSAAVKSGPELAACVGVTNAGMECGPFVTNSKTSYQKLIFDAATYNNHLHSIADIDYNLSYIK